MAYNNCSFTESWERDWFPDPESVRVLRRREEAIKFLEDNPPKQADPDWDRVVRWAAGLPKFLVGDKVIRRDWYFFLATDDEPFVAEIPPEAKAEEWDTDKMEAWIASKLVEEGKK